MGFALWFLNLWFPGLNPSLKPRGFLAPWVPNPVGPVFFNPLPFKKRGSLAPGSLNLLILRGPNPFPLNKGSRPPGFLNPWVPRVPQTPGL